jgi:hypothetical protein
MGNLSKRNARSTPSTDSVAGHLSEQEESMLIQEIREPVRKNPSSDLARTVRCQKQGPVQETRMISLDDLANHRR